MATPKGFRHSPETKAKMAEAHRRRGYVITPEQREKMIVGQRAAASTPEYREARAAAQRGKKHTAETRSKMSASHTGKIKTAEHCAAISAAKKGVPQAIPQTTEQREKNRQAQLGNQRAVGWGKNQTPEQSARRSEDMKRRWVAGMYDHKHPCWGRPGVHAGVRMRCLNSEGVFARDLDRAGISWVYEPRRFKLSWCSYKPDFYLPEFDVWVEVKGYAEQPGDWPRRMESFHKETGKTVILVLQRELSSLTYGGESDVSVT